MYVEIKSLFYVEFWVFISKFIVIVYKFSLEFIYNVVCVLGFFMNVGIILNF